MWTCGCVIIAIGLMATTLADSGVFLLRLYLNVLLYVPRLL